MANYQLVLTPQLVAPNTEGSMDTSILNGVSIQRTGYIEVYNSGKRKIVEPKDGGTFTDTIPVWSDDSHIKAL